MKRFDKTRVRIQGRSGSTARWLLVLAAIMPGTAWMDAPAHGQVSEKSGKAPDTARSVERVPLPAVAGGYRKRWALVIGINYLDKDRQAVKAEGKVSALTNAEADAEAVAKVLEQKYGFKDDKGKVVLLKGQSATRDNIMKHIQAQFLGGQDVSKEDCVLLYFAGHGERVKDDDDRRKGYLLPIDAELEPDGALRKHRAITLEDVQDFLGKSAANHKLLILDSCYSASLFRAVDVGGASGGKFENLEVKADVFHTGAFQAITSSRAAASDGPPDNKNSPFTSAFVRALNSIPLTLPSDQYRFTANQLFVPMQQLTSDLLQSAQCRWLDAERGGEFHFFPDAGTRFGEESDVPDDYRFVLLAMVPSTFGNWWADEMPWFMPSLRMEILKNVARSRSSGMLEKGEIRKAAETTEAKLKADPELNPHQVDRLAHLRLMFDMEPGLDRIEAMRAVIEGSDRGHKFRGLLELTRCEKPAAEDLHYLGVLYQQSNKPAEAKKAYEEALARYEAEELTSLESRVLKVLCLLDLGMLELNVLGNSQSAFERFAAAERRFNVATPAPFRVFCLTKQAEALRREGVIGRSDARMATAQSILATSDPDNASLLTAAAYKHDAWGCMETWRFPKAKERFDKTRSILQAISKSQGDLVDESIVDKFHVEHGLALIERFQGREASALAAYRELTPDILEAIQKLEQSPQPPPNYAELRNLLYERLVNSLERQADCSLFGQSPDFLEAADDYRRALEALEFLPPAKQQGWRRDLGYRRVIALALGHASAPAPLTPPSPARRETLNSLDLAQHLMADLDASGGNKLDRKPADPKIAQLVRWLEWFGTAARPDVEAKGEKLARLLAKSCLAYAAAARKSAGVPMPAGSPCPVRQEADSHLYALVRELSDKPRHIDRDVLERLMFAYRLLIEHSHEGLDSMTKVKLADSLVKLCRSALRSAKLQDDQDRTGLLRYLRPYLDAAFITKADLEGDQVKELIDIVYLATTGNSYQKIAQKALATDSAGSAQMDAAPVLAMYHVGSRCYIVVDCPRGASTMVAVDRPLDDIRMVAQTKSYLSCPVELDRVFQGLEASRDRHLQVLWRDPVHGIGNYSSSGHTPGTERPAGEVVPYYFPFKMSRFAKIVEFGLSPRTAPNLLAPGPGGEPPRPEEKTASGPIPPVSAQLDLQRPQDR